MHVTSGTTGTSILYVCARKGKVSLIYANIVVPLGTTGTKPTESMACRVTTLINMTGTGRKYWDHRPFGSFPGNPAHGQCEPRCAPQCLVKSKGKVNLKVS